MHVQSEDLRATKTWHAALTGKRQNVQRLITLHARWTPIWDDIPPRCAQARMVVLFPRSRFSHWFELGSIFGILSSLKTSSNVRNNQRLCVHVQHWSGLCSDLERWRFPNNAACSNVSGPFSVRAVEVHYNYGTTAALWLSIWLRRSLYQPTAFFFRSTWSSQMYASPIRVLRTNLPPLDTKRICKTHRCLWRQQYMKIAHYAMWLSSVS